MTNNRKKPRSALALNAQLLQLTQRPVRRSALVDRRLQYCRLVLQRRLVVARRLQRRLVRRGGLLCLRREGRGLLLQRLLMRCLRACVTVLRVCLCWMAVEAGGQWCAESFGTGCSCNTF